MKLRAPDRRWTGWLFVRRDDFSLFSYDTFWLLRHAHHKLPTSCRRLEVKLTAASGWRLQSATALRVPGARGTLGETAPIIAWVPFRCSTRYTPTPEGLVDLLYRVVIALFIMTIIRIWYVLWKRCLSVDQTWLLFAFSGCSVSAWPNPCHRLSLQNVFCLPRAETWPQTGVECVCHFAHFAGDWWGWGGLTLPDNRLLS